jgi:hypothetical protein
MSHGVLIPLSSDMLWVPHDAQPRQWRVISLTIFLEQGSWSGQPANDGRVCLQVTNACRQRRDSFHRGRSGVRSKVALG